MDDRLEIEKLRAALVAMGRMLPGVVIHEQASTDFLCELPGEMSHYRLVLPSRAVTEADLRLAGVKEGLEMAANYVDGQGGLIPGATAFVPLITGDNQPCMSGDARDRMQAHKRRQFDDATRSLSSAIRAIPVKADH